MPRDRRPISHFAAAAPAAAGEARDHHMTARDLG